MKQQSGSALMSALISVIILAATGAGAVRLYSTYQANQYVTNRAAQIGATLQAADAYSRKNETALQNAQPVAGFANAYNPTVPELTAKGFMPASYTDVGLAGGPVKISIHLEPTGCTGAKCQLAIAAYPTSSITDKTGKPDAATAAKIASALPNGSGWTNSPSDVTKLVKNSFQMPSPLGTLPAVVVAQEWIGSNQPSSTVPPVTYETNTVADCAYGGTTTYQRSVTTDKWGAVTYGSWVYLYDTCATPPAPSPPPPPPPPSTCANGGTDYPTCTPPAPGVCANGATDYPTCTPPAPSSLCANGASNYPTCTLSICANGASNYPTCTSPVCVNGASDYPTCTPPVCANGASDYPTCTPPVCGNGASNYPTCKFPPTPPTGVTTCTTSEKWWYAGGTCGWTQTQTCSDGTSTVLDSAQGTMSQGHCNLD